MRTAQLLSPMVALALAGGVGLAGAGPQTKAVAEVAAAEEIWSEPTDLETRDLFRGPADGPPPPDPAVPFTFVKKDTTGRSPGYDVRDPDGVVWSVKLGVEAQSEVAASRILWAMGFHQPPTYYVESWILTGQEAGAKPGGRFRPQVSGQRVVGEWKWENNPFARTRPMAGLLVAQMLINNWDLKSSNNKIYETTGTQVPRRRYVVRDLGAALGFNEQSKWVLWLGFRTSQGTKNDPEGFEKSEFIDRVGGNRVTFSYRGPNEPLLANIRPADVKWTCQLASRLSDTQWQDAFRAAGYSPETSARYIVKFKEKIAQGLALS